MPPRAVSRWLLIVEAQVRSQVSPSGIYGRKVSTGTGHVFFSESICFTAPRSLMCQLGDEQWTL